MAFFELFHTHVLGRHTNMLLLAARIGKTEIHEL